MKHSQLLLGLLRNENKEISNLVQVKKTRRKGEGFSFLAQTALA